VKELNNTKRNLVFVAAALFIWLCKYYTDTKNGTTNNITIDGIVISKTPAIEVINDICGNAVDADKTSDCLLPAYYELIKDDTAEVRRFKEIGFHVLSGDKQDSSLYVFRNCILENIIDTNGKINFTAEMKAKMMTMIKQKMATMNLLANQEIESLCNCMVDSLNNLTVRDYFSDDYLKNERIQVLFNRCKQQAKIPFKHL